MSKPVALVIGAAAGIGAATAEQLAAAGFALALCDPEVDVFGATAAGGALIALAERLRAAGTPVIVQPLPADSSATADELVTSAAELGTLRAVVNCAGILQTSEALAWDLKDLERMRRAHLDTVFFTSRAGVRAMLPQRRGAIVNFTSASAFHPTASPIYGAMKAGIAGFTRALAFELQTRGITVNAITPFAMTRMPAANVGRSPDGHLDQLGALAGEHPLPLPHTLPTSAVAKLVVGLVGDAAAGVTGKVIGIAGTQLFTMTPSIARATVIGADDGSYAESIHRLVISRAGVRSGG